MCSCLHAPVCMSQCASVPVCVPLCVWIDVGGGRAGGAGEGLADKEPMMECVTKVHLGTQVGSH